MARIGKSIAIDRELMKGGRSHYYYYSEEEYCSKKLSLIPMVFAVVAAVGVGVEVFGPTVEGVVYRKKYYYYDDSCSAAAVDPRRRTRR